MRSIAALPCLLVVACATATGELRMRVDTPTAIARIEFMDEANVRSVHVAGIPAGRSEQSAKVHPGYWCLVEAVLAIGDVGATLRPRAKLCVDVREGASADFGELILDGSGMRRSGDAPSGAVPNDDPSPAVD